MAALKSRLFVIAWGTIEILLFAGLIFGWASLVYVFKKDGYFGDLCSNDDNGNDVFEYKNEDAFAVTSTSSGFNTATATVHTESELSTTTMPREMSMPVASHNVTSSMKRRPSDIGCRRLDEQFNLIYTLAVTFNGVTTFFSGYLMDRLGTRICRCIGIASYLCATLLIAFSTPGMSLLLFPGMILLAFGGYFFLLTNLQLSNLFVHVKSTIISLYCGAFDSSAFVLIIIKIAYDAGMSVQTSFLILTALFSMCIVSTFWFMPSDRIPFPLPASYRLSLTCSPSQGDPVPIDEAKEPMQNGTAAEAMAVKEKEEKGESFRTAALSRLFIMDVFWLTAQRFQSWSFVGRLNPALVKLTAGDMQLVSQYTSVYASLQFFGILLAPLSGRLMDRKRQPGASPEAQKIHRLEMCIASFVIDTTLGLLLAVSVSIPILEVQYASFALHVLHRAMLYGPNSAFIAQVYGSKHFGKLFGLAMSLSAVFGLLQYPLFVLVQGPLGGNPLLFNMFVLMLMVLSYAHPLYIWQHCRQKRRRQQLSNGGGGGGGRGAGGGGTTNGDAHTKL